jgi:biotin carboxylase
MAAPVFLLHSRQPLGAGTRDTLEEYGGREAVILTERKGPLFRNIAGDTAIEVIQAEKAEWLSIIRTRSACPEILTNDEYCLEDCRELRRAVGLDDPFPRELTHYRDKAAMRRALVAHGVPVPRGDELPAGGFDLVAVRAAARRCDAGGDVIVKPRSEANLRGIFRINDLWRDPDPVLGSIDPASGYVIEQFLDGDQYHVELVVRDHEIATLMVGRYLTPLLDLARGRISGSITLPPGDARWGRLAEYAVAAVRALGAAGRFVAHVEFLSAGDALYVGEVACRAPGGEVPWQCEKNSGVDVERLNLELQMGRPAFELQTGRPMTAATQTVAASWIWIPGSFVPPADNTTGGDFVKRFLGHGWLSTDPDHEALARRTASAQNLLARPRSDVQRRR